MIEVFANRLTALMKDEDLSQRALSIKAEVERKSIKNWISGRFYPRYVSLIKLANYFKVSIDYLIGTTDENYDEYFSKYPITEVHGIFVSRLKELMKDKSMTFYELSKKLDLGQSSISKWINLESMPETTILLGISKLFDCSVDYLLGRDKL